jgi:hypothetical protein
MHYKHYFLLAALSLGLLPGLAACGSRSSSPLPLAAAELTRGLPFPADRAVSTETPDVYQGSAAEQQAGGTAQGSSLLLTGPANGAAFAVYHFQVGDAPDHVNLTLGDETTEYYLALANFSKQRWDVSGPYTSERSFQLDLLRHQSEFKHLYVALLAADGAVVKIDAVQLTVWDIAGTHPATGGVSCSLAVANGNPAIAYCDSTTSDVKYVRATDVDGASWGTPKDVDIAGNINMLPVLAIVDGNPAIAYADGSHTDIKFARAADANGDAWGAPQLLDATDNVGGQVSLGIVNGFPAVSYMDYTLGDLKFVRAQDAQGTQWNTPQTLDSADFVGADSSLTVVDGLPAISYHDQTHGWLKYIRAQDADGAAWAAPQVADDFGAGCTQTCLTVVNGLPAISYLDGTSAICYTRASDAAGSSWSPRVTVGVLGIAMTPRLVVVDGKPAIGYYDNSIGVADLRYVRARDADGAAWDEPLTLDAADDVGQNAWLAVVNGKPAMSYYDTTNMRFKFIRMR